MISNWCNSHNVTCTILRLPLLVGNNPPGNLGNMINAIRKGYYFNINHGRARKSVVLAEDVAMFIPIVASIGGCYNLTDGHHPSFKDLSEAIAKKKVFNLNLSVARFLGNIGNLFGRFPLNTSRIIKMTSDLTFDDNSARKIGWSPQSVVDYIYNNGLNN